MMRKLIVVLVLIGLIQSTGLSAQNTRSEEDSIECLKNYSLYSLSFKKKMYDYAMPAWRDMFNHCPDVTISIYSDGVALYKHYIDKEKDPARKLAYVDSMMMVYDQRIQYFGTHPKYPEGWILGRKAVDLVKYRRNNLDALTEAQAYFEKSYSLQTMDIEPLVALNWLQTTNALAKKEKISADEVLDVYIKVDEVIADQLLKETDESKKGLLAKVSQACGEILTESGFSDCNLLVTNLDSRYEAIKEDQGAVNRLLELMNDLDCTDNELFAKASEQNYKLNPNASAAYFLAKFFIKKDNMDRAVEYYQKAIELDDNEELKAKYYYELALITFSYYKNGPKAREYAYDALEYNHDWGKPHILIGNIYAMESKNYGSNEFEHKTVYWVALDRYKKAKSVDPDCLQEAEKQIALYSQYLPDKETGFFHGIQEGSKYKVGSWINEETTVRYR